MSRQQELEAFRQIVDGPIRLQLEAIGYGVEWLDEEVVAVVSPFAAVKIYCAGGHGYNFTITIAPQLHRGWNNKEEIGLALVAAEHGVPFRDQRFDNIQAFRRALEASVQPIVAVLALPRK
jgi:hypothetical protein